LFAVALAWFIPHSWGLSREMAWQLL